MIYKQVLQYTNNSQVCISQVDTTTINNTKPFKSYRIYHINDASLNVMVQFYHRSRRRKKKFNNAGIEEHLTLVEILNRKLVSFTILWYNTFKYVTTAVESVQSSTIRCFYSQCLFKTQYTIYSLVNQNCENGFSPNI